MADNMFFKENVDWYRQFMRVSVRNVRIFISSKTWYHVYLVGAALLNFGGNLATLFGGCFIAGTSISMVMPQCMLQASMSGKTEQIAMSTAIVMAASNLGTFLTPVITNLAAAISGSGAVYFSYVTSITLAVVGAVIIFVCQVAVGKKKKSN